MNALDILKRSGVKAITMSELFAEARTLGKVNIFSMDEGYSVDIKFETIKHIELKASSGFKHATVEGALQVAIDKAKEIKAQFR